MRINPRNKNELYSGQALEVLDYKLSLTIVVSNKQTKRKRIQHRPAGLGWFTLRDLQHILTTIQTQPFRTSHIFVFEHGRYIAKIYKEEDEMPETVPNKPGSET